MTQLDSALLLLSLVSCGVSAWLLHRGRVVQSLRPTTRRLITLGNIVFLGGSTLYFLVW